MHRSSRCAPSRVCSLAMSRHRCVVLGDHRLAKSLGAVGVRSFADHQHRGVLRERRRGIQRRHRRLVRHVPRRPLDSTDRLGDLADVLGRRAAASADQRQPELGDEPGQRLGQLFRRERVFRAVGAQHRQPRVRHHRHRDARMAGQVAEVLTHLGRAGGAVQADHVDTERLDRGQRRADLAAEQHRARRLHRHMREHRDVPARLRHRAPRAEHRGLELQQVLARLDQDRVGAAVQHPECGLRVRVADDGVLGVTQCRQLGARPHRAEHVALGIGCADLVGDAAGDRGALLRQLTDPVGDVVVAQVGQVAAERVGFDRVGTGLEIRPVDVLQHVGPGVVEDFVAALEAVEVVERQIRCLKHRAHGAVTHHDLLRKGRQQVGVIVPTRSSGHPNRVVGLPNRGFRQAARGVNTRSTLK